MIEGIIPILSLLVLFFLVLTVVVWIGNSIRLYISRSLSLRQSNTASVESPFEKKATTKEHRTCPFCKEEIKSYAVKCKHCNSFLNTKSRNAMASMIAKICPYCQFSIKQDSEAVQCQGCEMPHHKECWEDNDGCTTFGCNETTFKVPAENRL